jgi:predicted secreted protein
VVVINLGDDPLIDVTLTDSNGHTYGAAFDLTVGESLTFSYTSNPTATVTNTVTATGTDSLGGVVSDTDSAAVSVIAPVIDVEIAVSPATIRQGDQVTWTILVTNTGSDPLTHVRLTDTNGHHYGGFSDWMWMRVRSLLIRAIRPLM